jgi:uncharacterized protein
MTLALALLGAFCLGVSKAGFPGLALINILIIAECFGAKASVGLILPLLILCDIIVYPLFRQYASWSKVWPLLPATLAGLVAGFFLLKAIDDTTARKVIGGIILMMAALQFLRESKKNFLENLPEFQIFGVGTGLAIGIATMVANAAGPIYSIYALVHKMSKNDFLGVGARFFLLVNLIKVPFLGHLTLINPDSLKLNLLLVPGILLGIFTGRKLIHLIPQKTFEILLYLFSLIAGLRLLFYS